MKPDLLEMAAQDMIDFCDGPTNAQRPDIFQRRLSALKQALESAKLEAQPVPPHECQTEGEKKAHAFGWWEALETVRDQPVGAPAEMLADIKSTLARLSDEQDQSWTPDARSALLRLRASISMLAAAPSLPTQSVGVPAGWKLVPIEPTYAMAQAYLKANHEEAMKGSMGIGASDPKLNFKAGYTAMLAAAPSLPVLPVEPAITQQESFWLTLREELHPKTVNLVVRFSRALAKKLAEAEKKYGYSDGWVSSDWMDECRAKLTEHVAKGDPRDVAAYCAFLWHHGEKTALPVGEKVQDTSFDGGENPTNKQLYILMAPFSLNLVVGDDMKALLNYGRAVWRKAQESAAPAVELPVVAAVLRQALADVDVPAQYQSAIMDRFKAAIAAQGARK